MIPEAVVKWLEENKYGAVSSLRSAVGGCINNGLSIETDLGARFFLKSNSSAPKDMFAREAEGLEELRRGPGPRFPEPHLAGPDFLLLEDLSPAVRKADYWPEMGLQLAVLHKRTERNFGFAHDNYIGSNPQPNPWTDDGYAFFAEHRLEFQARLARDAGLLAREEADQIRRLAARLSELVPKQPPSLLHGDLWGGNAISDSRGGPALIDPAVHYGWPEAELGMTLLFGGFDSVFYTAYEEAYPMEPAWQERLPVYNLYHLLNHLNLFGGGYYSQVLNILHRFS